MKLHELKQKRNTIATDMRALHDKIGDANWTDEQRTQWNASKSELDSLDERIAVRKICAVTIRHLLMSRSLNSASVRKTRRCRPKGAAPLHLIAFCATASAN